MKVTRLMIVGFGLGVFLVVTGFAYLVFSFFRPTWFLKTVKLSSAQTSKFKVPTKKYADLPKTEECPLNGGMFSKPEKDLWEKRRPLGVMVENSALARPQSGISFADVVYEAVAEGGITRFLLVFYCQDPEIVGPTRSARTYYLDWISEYGNSPLYAHIGGANTPGSADAQGQIRRYGWAGFNDFDGIAIGLPVFVTDRDRLGKDSATEHSRYTMTTKLWEVAANKRGLSSVEIDDLTGKEVRWDKNFVSYKFKDDVSLSNRPDKLSVEFGLSGIEASYAGDYVVRWEFDKNSNTFRRFNGGIVQKDLNSEEQIVAKNVAIIFTTLSVADDGYDEEGHGQHFLYGTKGTGRAKLFLDGKVIDGTWSKKGRLDRTRFFDEKGVEMKFNRGPIWIEVLPIGQQVTISK